MEIKNPIYEDFDFEQIYHLFTRVSGNEYIFRNEGNYVYFLEKVAKYMLPYMDIYAYCLAPQRFSFLVCFRSQKEIFRFLNMEEKELSEAQRHKFLMQPISNMLNSYSKAYNKMYNRKGALFVDFIKREKLDDEEKLKNIFRYIHQIPIENKLKDNAEDWRFSSYKSYLEMEKPSKINRNFMMSFFENKQELIEFYKNLSNLN